MQAMSALQSVSPLKRTSEQAFLPSAYPQLPVLSDDATSSDDSSHCESGEIYCQSSRPAGKSRKAFPAVVRYKGVRQRSWGRWVTEIREPATRQRVWLGSYSSAEDAARVYDMASLMLRGAPLSRLNFPDNQFRPVTIPRSVAESLLKAVVSGQAARYAAGKPGATPPSDAPLTTFNSEHVRMEVSGNNVVLSECPLAPVTITTSQAQPASSTPASSAPSSPLAVQTADAFFAALSEQKYSPLSAVPKMESVSPSPAAAPSGLPLRAPSFKAQLESGFPEVAFFDAVNLSDEELFGSASSEDDVKPSISDLLDVTAPAPDAAATVAPAVAPAPFSAVQQETTAGPAATAGWLCLSDLMGFDDDLNAPFSPLPNVAQPPFAEDFWLLADAPAKKQRV